MHEAHATDPATQAHVLVVEDDPEVSALVVRYLSGHGLRVTPAMSGREMLAAFTRGPVDVLLLDLGLPGEDGLSLLRTLRAQWNGPVIIVSGRGETVERVVGLELGADDYVAKPFDFRELLARIRSVLRRAERTPVEPRPQASTNGKALHFEGLRLELGTRRLLRDDGTEIPLSSGEFGLLAALAEKPGHVFSRDALMQRLHGHDAGPFDRAIDVQVGRLRRKIEQDPERPAIIKSVRGAGYVFAARVMQAG